MIHPPRSSLRRGLGLDSHPLNRDTFTMNEIIFIIDEAAEGGYVARALGESIFTEADSLNELHANVRDAVRCHFEEGQQPKILRLHHVKEEVIAV